MRLIYIALLSILVSTTVFAQTTGSLANDTKTKNGNYVNDAYWALYPALTPVDLGTNSISIGGVARTNWPNTANEWSTFPASTNVDMAGYSVDNVNTAKVNALILGGSSRTNWPNTSDTWSEYPATHDVNMSNYSITLGSVTRGTWPNDYLSDTNLFLAGASTGSLIAYTNTVTFPIVYSNLPFVVISWNEANLNQIAQPEVIASSKSNFQWRIRNSAGYLATNWVINWVASEPQGGLAALSILYWSLYPAQHTLDMGGHSITNVSTNSIYFSDGTTFGSSDITKWDSTAAKTNLSQFSNDLAFITTAIADTYYSVTSHNHNASYSPTNHTHSSYITSDYTWARSPAVTNVDVGTYGIILGGVNRTNWPTYSSVTGVVGGVATMTGAYNTITYPSTFAVAPVPFVMIADSNCVEIAQPIVISQSTSNFTFKVLNSSGIVYQAWSVNWNALKTGD